MKFRDSSRRFSLTASVDQKAQLVRDSDFGVAMNRVGISTPSGIPDFPSPQPHLWNPLDMMEVTSVPGLRQRPEACYVCIRPLEKLVLTAEPDTAHVVLARLQKANFVEAIITQIIDPLHGQPGSQVVNEIHGNIREATWLHDYRKCPSQPLIEKFGAERQLPLCRNVAECQSQM